MRIWAIESTKIKGFWLNWAPCDEMCEWGAYMDFEHDPRRDDRTHTIMFKSEQEAWTYLGKVSSMTTKGWAGKPVDVTDKKIPILTDLDGNDIPE
jgi:hypothetical protein